MDRRAILGAMAALSAGFTPLPARAAGRATGYIRTNWLRDPFALGSYSYIAKGQLGGDAATVAAPIDDRIFFAGEALSPDYNGTVHAAYESGQYAADAVMETDAERVAVIGAGASGLAVASTLQDEGYTVKVFEARRRFGGRVWTNTALGMPLDLGASWIHGTDGNPLKTLVDAHGVETKKTDFDGLYRGGDGREMSDASVPDWMEEVAEVQHLYGASSDQIDFGAYEKQDDYDGPEVIFPGGYMQVFRPLIDGLNISLATEITRIALTGSGVTLTTRAGAQNDYDAVVCTAPLGVLKSGSIAFDPELSDAKQAALARMQMGVLDKVYLRFRDVFWDTDSTWIETPETGLPPGQFNSWFNMAKFIDQPVLLAFNGGDGARALSPLDDAEVIARAEQVLAGAYPE